MRYYRPSVIDFADRAVHALLENTESNTVEKTLDQFKDWNKLFKAVENTNKAYKKSKNSQDLAAFLSALSLAEQYLQKTPKHVDKRQEKLENYVDHAIKIADTMKELNHIRRPVKDPATREPEVQTLIDSEKFQALITYQKLLARDNRSHTFLGFNLKVDKAGTLNELIEDLKNCETIGEIKDVLDAFYDGKGKVIAATGEDSPYEILNKGQNITTRFFNPFGMRSRSIELIDKLAAQVGLGNDAPEQDSYGLH